jgi:outer membrane protein
MTRSPLKHTRRRFASGTDLTSRKNSRGLVPTIVGAALLAALSHAPASAQEQPLAAGESRWGLGLGAGFIRKPYRGYGNDTLVLPVLTYENKWISVAGPGLDLKLPSAGPVSFRLRARYGLNEGYDEDDSDFLRGMEKRKASIWLGGLATWHTPYANVTAEVQADASGNSKGQKFSLGVDKGFKLGDFRLTPRLAAVWANADYVDYYYGVRASEATAARPAYAGRSTVNIETGLRVDYLLGPRQVLFLDVSATQLGSEIKDSPIVERSNQSAIRFGYVYRF